MSNGGGAATNTGIDYQQRLAAYFLIQMLLDIETLSGIGLDGVHAITEVSFESSSYVDDMVVKTTTGNLYVQAKRNISMSDSSDSEFMKTVHQFVNQFLQDPSGGHKFVLATSSGSSSKIKQELRKILESIRLNDTGFKDNPLNKSEEDVYTKVKNCISTSYLEITNNNIADTTISDILSKTYVAIADVQQGMPLEGAILTILTSKSRVKPELFFSATISLALSLASARQSINKSGLESKLGNYIGTLTPEKKHAVEQDFFKIEMSPGKISSGREVLLVESFIDGQDFLVVELIRFDDSGSKKVKFHDNLCELLNGSTWNVLSRASTYSGIERYIEERADEFKDKNIGFLPINTEEDIENSPFALAYGDYCEDIRKGNDQPLRCLHCGDSISENGAPLVEIDEIGAEHALGLVHKKCLSPLDRVLGGIKAEVFDEYDYLKDFDYKTWFEFIQTGQAMFGSLEGKLNQIMFMGWNPEGHGEFKGNYCVKINLEDGSSKYVHHRSKVVRETLESATKRADFFNMQFEKARIKGDPSCYTSNNETFSSYSVAIKMKDEDEECIECIDAEAVKYTLAIEKAYDRFTNYYAPLFILLDLETSQPIIIENAIFILNNPLKLKTYLSNWSKAGIELPEYKIEILKTDHEFDLFLSRYLKKGIQIVANPLFDMVLNPLSGLVFRHIDEILEEKAKR
ncbi:hypothetical protein GeomeDRAFT_3303 [Geobacter metallireducens RCH3]|uniref:Uncharacterized protein n=2 Tax=Geobacter metallireducens TaxID=28232 RepID=Q39RV6_GEOMG|nr:hypothetical protein [Geobacter metallireducens]ABB33018.2 hypothetical protein Gmet_2800 [Geobacter metallireducens GS-15]EHP84049.1 hypothetical protein GeomeDRAFT_3303 [Geobacter metallireducens RCH3]